MCERTGTGGGTTLYNKYALNFVVHYMYSTVEARERKVERKHSALQSAPARMVRKV